MSNSSRHLFCIHPHPRFYLRMQGLISLKARASKPPLRASSRMSLAGKAILPLCACLNTSKRDSSPKNVNSVIRVNDMALSIKKTKNTRIHNYISRSVSVLKYQINKYQPLLCKRQSCWYLWIDHLWCLWKNNNIQLCTHMHLRCKNYFFFFYVMITLN